MAQHPKSVLWIDDEADLLESHRIFLREKGFEVESATNADDAVEMLRRRAYGIVLLDEQMPGKRGLEAYREIRELDPLLPIIMVTKSEEDATLKEAIGVDVRDYLVKPINPRQVLAVITRVLDGPRIRQQAIARSFVERFRAIELDRQAPLDW
ncbi:MAG: response regulator, partial [Gemmatimonadota bacterium]